MNVLITLCARGGSKGIPGKNIRPLNGKPLIAYSIETAKRYAKTLPHAHLALSTDSEQIALVANDAGLETTYRRPPELASDTAGKIATIADLLVYEEGRLKKSFDRIVDLDVTSPLRTVADLQLAMEALNRCEEAVNIFSVSPAARNPYFNMVEVDADGYARVSKPPTADVTSRQSAPRVYDMNASFYIYKRSFFSQGYQVATTPFSLAYVTPHECFDLDHPIDFEFMEFLLANDKLDFEF